MKIKAFIPFFIFLCACGEQIDIAAADKLLISVASDIQKKPIIKHEENNTEPKTPPALDTKKLNSTLQDHSIYLDIANNETTTTNFESKDKMLPDLFAISDKMKNNDSYSVTALPIIKFDDDADERPKIDGAMVDIKVLLP